jgi:hypothetical protein
VKGREVLAANSSAQLKERHTDDQRVSCKPSYKFHGTISTDCKVKTIQPSTDKFDVTCNEVVTRRRVSSDEIVE